MTRTITAMFDSYSDASAAVQKLKAAGVSEADISIVSNDASERARYSDKTSGVDHSPAAESAATGASIGTLVGGGAGLLTGLGLMAIPGVGPVVAAGWLASTLVGAGVGAVTGGAIGALTGLGISESDAHSYAEGIKRGGTLVSVRAEESQAARVTDILDDDGTVDMAEREEQWRKDGWSGRYSGSDDYAPGTTGSVAPSTIGAAASTTTGVSADPMAQDAARRRRVGNYAGV